MNLLLKLRHLLREKRSDQSGSLNPDRLKDVSPLTPQKEATLRGLYYDCANIKILLDELDRRDEIIRATDHELWLMVNKPNRRG